MVRERLIVNKQQASGKLFGAILFAVALTAIALPWLISSPVLIIGLLLSLTAAVIIFLFFYRPLWALLGFVLVLPFHSLLATVMLVQFGLPVSVVRVASSWKELILFTTMLLVLLRILSRQRLPTLTWLDGISLLWLVQIAFYSVIGSLNPVWQPSITARVYGTRDWLLYLVPYFIGRLVWTTDSDLRRILRAVLLVGVITSLFGLIEYFFLPIEFHVLLGVPQYFSEMLGLVYPDYLFGLPENYFAEVRQGEIIRRSVSTYLSGQGFAVSFLVVFPVVFTWYVKRPTNQNMFALVVCAFALLLTITRMTIIVCSIQMILILLLTRHYKILQGILVSGVLLFIVALMVYPDFRSYVMNTVLLQDTSSSTRLNQWAGGIQTLLEHPFGSGVGYSGLTGTRFGGSGAGQEAGYLKITGDLGLPGILFFILWFGGILFFSLNLFWTSEGDWKTLSLVVFTTAVGFLLNNVTAPPDQSPFVIYVFPFMAGIVIGRYVNEWSLRRRVLRMRTRAC
jgi:hypothetical protein